MTQDERHPFDDRQSPQEYFRTMMHTVLGQALNAAGYKLRQERMKWIGGRFRYSKALTDDLTGFIEFQVLIYNDNAYAAGMPSRFQVSLYRSDRAGGQPSKHPQYARRTLSQLVVEDFGIDILPTADHWWTFKSTDELGAALAEAGHLVVGYGIQWLAGELSPD